jgi:hypothetical protein
MRVHLVADHPSGRGTLRYEVHHAEVRRGRRDCPAHPGWIGGANPVRGQQASAGAIGPGEAAKGSAAAAL